MLIGLFASYRLARGACPTQPLYSRPNLMDPRASWVPWTSSTGSTLTATKARKPATRLAYRTGGVR